MSKTPTTRRFDNSSTAEINRRVAAENFAPKNGEAVFNLRSVLNADPPQGNGGQVVKLSFVGYSGAPVDVGDYGFDAPIIYNTAGIRHKNSIPILHEHWTPIGHTTGITNNGTSISGEGVTSYPSDVRGRVVEALQNGFPFEASMGLRVENENDIVFLREGESRTVNNRTITGPMYVVERSIMNEMTITMSGRDSDTQFELLNKDAITMLKNSVPRSIKNSTPPAPPAEPPAVPPVAPPAAPASDSVLNNAVTPPPAPPAPPAPAPAAPSVLNNAQTFSMLRLLNRYPEQGDFIEKELSAGKSITEIENSIKLTMFENGLPRVPDMTPSQRTEAGDTILAHFALSCGVTPEIVEKHVGKKVADIANNAPRWGWVETLLNIANAQEGQRRFTGFSDIDVMCGNIKNHNRRTMLNASFSTIDMPNLLKKAGDMMLEQRWTINEPFAAKFLKEESNKDFRKTERYRTGGGRIWDPLTNDGKIEMTEFGPETRYMSELDTVAQLVAFSRRDIINDDMGAIADMLAAMVEGALIVPDMKLGKKLLVQAASAGTFWVDADNSRTSTAFTAANLSVVYPAIRQYNENRGKNYVNVISDRWTLIHGIELEEAVFNTIKQDRIVNDTTASTKTGDKNYWYNRFDTALFPQMNNSSLLGSGPFVHTSTWILWPSSKQFSPYSITYLRGQKRPTIEPVELPENMLGAGWRGYWDVEINEREREAIVRCRA